MTPEQIKYRNYLIAVFNDHNHDMEATIKWMYDHFPSMHTGVREAHKQLTIQQRNEVMREILMGV